MKYILAFIMLSISVHSFSQQADWTNLGKEIGYDFYYKKSTIIRGENPFVVVVGVPLQEMKDPSNNVVKYVTVNVLFYQSTAGLRSRISNHIYYYEDNTFKKVGLPQRDVPITFYNLLLRLYDAIR